jgi:hypothetical protein
MAKAYFLLGVAVLHMGLGACASRGAGWPTLMTPEEQRTGKPQSATAVATPAPEAAPPPTVSNPVDAAAASRLRAQIARLDVAERDADMIGDRWQKQYDRLAQNASAVKVKSPADSNWNTAQLELTRLGQIAAEWDDLLDTSNGIAGQLALASHGGADVKAEMPRVGALLARIEAAQTKAKISASAIRQKISK